MTEITGIWLRGGKNEMTVLVERDNKWHEVISEYLPLQGNDGNVWPVSHIAEEPLLARTTLDA